MKLLLIFSCLIFNPFLWAAEKTSLEDSFKSALTKNETVLQASELVNQADARVSRLRGGILPTLDFNLTHVIQEQPNDPVARSFSPQSQTTAGFSLTQPLFRGLREWRGLSQANYLRSAQEAAKEDAMNFLYRDLAMNYLQILSWEQDLANLKEQASLYDSRIKDLSSRVSRGETNQTDLVTAESTQNSLLAERRLIEGQLEGAREMFHFLTGLPPETELVDPDLIKSTKLEPLEKYLERIEERADIKEARERYEASEKAVSVAWGGHLPTLDLVGNYYLKRPGFLSDIRWDVGVKLNVPLFAGGGTQAQYVEAVSVRKGSTLELEKKRRAARREIRSLYRQVVARMDQLASLSKSAELSRKNTTLLQRDSRRGLSRNIDVQLALAEFRITQRNFDQAHFASQLDMLQLRIAAALSPIPKEPKQ